MFGGNNDDRQDGPAQPVPSIPPIRTFYVTLRNATFDVLDNFTVKAHEAEVNQMGNVVRFREYVMDPHEGPTNKVVKTVMRPADCWVLYHEVETVDLSVTH